MTQTHNTIWRWLILLGVACLPARAQESQFIPEFDAHLNLNQSFRAYVEAKEDRDGGDPTQFSVGPSIQFYLKRLVKLRDSTVFDLDDSKSRLFVLEAGYRTITAPNAPLENRVLISATSNFPLKAGLLLLDRNRADLDWKGGEFAWRYRNRLTLERTFRLRSRHHIPYVAVEPFYVSQYHKWSTTSLYAGSLFPLGKYVQLNAYYEHDNNTGKRPNHQVNSVGLALNLYFSMKSHHSSPSPQPSQRPDAK